MGGQVLIIGGGASGLMAAITAARNGAAVTVLEQNDRPGRKLLATGNGRCNLTNFDMSSSHYHCPDPSFPGKIIDCFSEKKTLDFFHSIGLLTKDRNGWVYPVTDQSLSVLNLLLMTARRLGVKIKTNERVISAGKDSAGMYAVKTGTWTYHAGSLVVACGSPASEVRGSSDDLTVFAGCFGIPVSGFLPSLLPLRVKGRGTKTWNGTRVHAKVTLLIDSSKAASDTGELQLTQNTVSGIPVFQISGAAVAALKKGRDVTAVLDLMPEMTEDDVRGELERRIKAFPGITASEMLTGLLPDRLAAAVLEAAGRNASPAVLASLIHHFAVNVTGSASVKQAQTCSGGVRTDALTEHLESRRVSGLFFCGETVDLYGDCGGYNLQWAWSSGYVAGLYVAQSARRPDRSSGRDDFSDNRR